ncbi:MAG TPA: helix-turn-helix transcriptional regulator [Tetragenococcus sp.]|nr:helix-turn-helix transcriptional regulator [Tetragenococcus sp.]
MNIGDKIKEQRLQKQWTQEQLAQLLNVSRSTVSSWEVGRNYPDLETIIAISDLFAISLDTLLREDKIMAKENSKKIKRGKKYKLALIIVTFILLSYAGFNMKLRFDEKNYRHNLNEYGWTQQKADTDLAAQADKNSYELSEGDNDYFTYVMPADFIGFPLKEQKLNIIARNDGAVVQVFDDKDINIIISKDNKKDASINAVVKVDSKGRLVKKEKNWTKGKETAINSYLEKYQPIHQELITTAIQKRKEIVQ